MANNQPADGPSNDRSAGWPLIENDLPPAPDPNYCVDLGAPGDRYAMDADLTLYWPDVRPCWEEVPDVESVT